MLSQAIVEFGSPLKEIETPTPATYLTRQVPRDWWQVSDCLGVSVD